MIKPVNKNRKINTDSFLEAFRDLGSHSLNNFKENIIKSPGKNLVDAFTGQGQANAETGESRNFSPDLFDQEAELEKKYLRQAHWQAEIVRKEEQVVYSRQDREVKLQVQSLQNEIQQLVKDSGQLAQEVQVASLQMPAEAGKYHLVFFEKLKNLIKALRGQIQESAQWLAEFNKKSKKRNFYWGQFKKKGTSFSLSMDRNVSTQTG